MSGSERTTGHLDELAYDRMRLEAPSSDPAFFAAAERHLAECSGCRQAFAALREVDRAFVLSPSPAMAARARGGGRGRLWAGVGAALALAAGVLVAVRVGGAPADDGLRARGGALELQVFVHDGRASQLVIDSAAARPGDRVAFRARVQATGWLLIVGWDDTRVSYPVHPDGAAFDAAPVAPMPDFVQLDAGLELDARPGAETLTGVFCPERFALADLTDPAHVDPDGLFARAQERGCAVRAVRLDKP